MIDHFTLTVRDLARSKEFYGKTLAPLGYALRMDFGQIVGFGDSHKPYLWLKAGSQPTTPMHLAFLAKDRRSVDAFHAAAIAAGARDDGQPGLRIQYHPDYYAAFAIDPDGHPIEAVCHAAIRARPTKKAAPRAPPKAAKRSTTAARRSPPKPGRAPKAEQARRQKR